MHEARCGFSCSLSKDSLPTLLLVFCSRRASDLLHRFLYLLPTILFYISTSDVSSYLNILHLDVIDEGVVMASEVNVCPWGKFTLSAHGWVYIHGNNLGSLCLLTGLVGSCEV